MSIVWLTLVVLAACRTFLHLLSFVSSAKTLRQHHIDRGRHRQARQHGLQRNQHPQRASEHKGQIRTLAYVDGHG